MFEYLFYLAFVTSPFWLVMSYIALDSLIDYINQQRGCH